MTRKRSDWEGLVVWAILASVIMFTITKHIWFDHISRGEKTLFWTNLAVAVGTLALAFVTWWNVRQTSAVILAEDRRHQQSFAPLVELWGPFGDRSEYDNAFELRNIGHGLALNVSLNITVTCRFNAPYDVEIAEEEAQERYRTNLAVSNKEGKRYKLEFERKEEAFDTLYFLSALKPQVPGAPLAYEKLNEISAWNPELEYESVELSYDDMFGNAYSTDYETSSLQYYSWKQPPHLRIPKTKDDQVNKV